MTVTKLIESILSDSDINFDNKVEVKKTSNDAYELIHDTLKEILGQMGVSLSI